MTCCDGRDNQLESQIRRSLSIDRYLEEERKRQRLNFKFLLLGPGESGKSTIKKQIKIIYQGGYTYAERIAFRPIIIHNVLDTAKALIAASDDLKIPLRSLWSSDCCAQIMSYDINTYSENASLSSRIVAAIRTLWKDPCIPEIINHPSALYLMDTAEYFVNELERISSPDYIPTNCDILRSRSRTTGMSTTSFSLGQLQLQLIELGGARGERKKWIHCFENTTSVLFVVALSDYDKVLFEESNQSRLDEALILFDSIVSSRWFTTAGIVIFLNKIDLFRERLTISPLKKYFPEYSGDSDWKKAAKFLTSKFTELDRSDRLIYPHITSAVDASNVRSTFDRVKNWIIVEMLGGTLLIE